MDDESKAHTLLKRTRHEGAALGCHPSKTREVRQGDEPQGAIDGARTKPRQQLVP